ncbi:MAG: hypothetical protein PHZ19_01775 [Candidatus Thermoplasmatota archaeon]|nr:hypothetical protein [Candidatus Thermoplasmatota archaeon]
MSLTLDQLKWALRPLEAESAAQETLAGGANAASARMAVRVVQERWAEQDGVTEEPERA